MNRSEIIERLRARAKSGEKFTVDQIARELDLSPEYVAEIALRHLDQPGGFILARQDEETVQ